MADTIGPVSGIPRDLLRPDVLLCVGEDPDECLAAWGGDAFTHSYRGFHAAVVDDRLHLVTPFGSTVMEALLWEILSPGVVQRILLVGTAGALGGFTGPSMEPLRVEGARPVYQCFDTHPDAVMEPSWRPKGFPGVQSISTDRFYGFSPTVQSMPAEPGMLEAWNCHGGMDGIVEMEVAAFFQFAKQFGAPALQYAAIKVVANDVSDLDSLPDGAGLAMERAVAAGLASFRDR